MFKVLVKQIWLPLINCKQPFSTFFPTFSLQQEEQQEQQQQQQSDK